jgi:class 3 adenylate cyclase/tetratricopeptide (TPR) repeat protein
MDCTNCGTTNDIGRKFCRECGARLSVQCPACGALESGGGKFCGECGMALITGGGQQPAIETRQEAIAERRLVSIVFADLVGFTTLAEGRDPEVVRELLSEYYEFARDVVKNYRGTIEKFIGDAVMAVWGAPVAREDDAERAVRCALDLVATVEGLAARRGMPDLALRAAVHTGEAAVSFQQPDQGLVVGDIVNTASRLQTAAEPGTVLVGEATQRAAGRSIGFRRLPDLWLKGKREPVAAWQATHLVAVAGEAAPQLLGLEAPFVGRTEELRLLKELYQATARERHARMVSIMGHAGVGKTRLAWELQKYATGLADESRWLHGRSPAYHEGVSYWALGEIVRRVAGVAEDEGPAESRRKLVETLEREVASEDDRQWLEPRLAALLGADETPQDDRGELFAAWRTLLEQLARKSPLVLVFEDLHWADGGMLDFIESVLQWSRSFPLLVVTLARPELVERRPTWGAGLRSFTSIHLDPLDEAQMRQLLEGLAPGLPPAIVEQVVERAEGVPLYAVETVRMLLDQGVLRSSDGGFEVTESTPRVALPETLHALIASRLDALPPGERRVLQDAAVLGQTFRRDALLAIHDNATSVDAHLASLVAKELLRMEGDPRSPERGQLAFVQSATREVAYAGLGRNDRRARHLAAADHFSGLADEESVGIVASHYLAAFQADIDHPQAPGLRQKAVEFLMAAADRARALHSYAQTLAYIEEALAITDDAARQAAMREMAGEVARAAEDTDEAQLYLSQAMAWYREQGNVAAQARAAAVLSTALIDGKRIEQALGLITDALGEVDQDDPSAVPLMANLARTYFVRGDSAAALEWADRAIAAGERAGDMRSVVEALINRAGAVDGLGRPREAQALWLGAKQLAERHGASISLLRAASNLASSEAEETPQAALQTLRSAIDHAIRAGELGYVSSLRSMILHVRLALGEWDAIIAEVAALEPEALLAHEWEHLNDALAVVHAFRGDESAARALLARWQSDPQKTVTQHEADHRHALGSVAFAQGRFDKAYEEGISAAAGAMYEQDGMFLAGRAALWLGDAHRLSECQEKFERGAVLVNLRLAQRATLAAGLAYLEDDDQQAVEAYREAISRWRQLENPLELALAHLEWSSFAATGTAANEAQEEARRLLVGLGAVGLIERLRNSHATKR